MLGIGVVKFVFTLGGLALLSGDMKPCPCPLDGERNAWCCPLVDEEDGSAAGFLACTGGLGTELPGLLGTKFDFPLDFAEALGANFALLLDFAEVLGVKFVLPLDFGEDLDDTEDFAEV